MSAKKTDLLFYLCIVLLLLFILLLNTITTAFPQTGENGDEDLDVLIQEFLDDSNKQIAKEHSLKKDENLIPLNAQSKFLKTEKCNCTKFFMCDVQEETEAEESEEGADISLINIRLNVPEGGCSHYLDICCEKIKQQIPSKTESAKQPLKKRTCGKRNIGGVGFRIVGGSDGEAQFGEFPWMAAITETRYPRYPDEKLRQAFVCGASILTPRAILSAAHCFQNKSAETLKVRVGEWDTQTTAELYPHQEVEVEKIIIHEEYSIVKHLVNDIAIAILKEDVELAPNVNPICLAPSGMNLDGTRCFASGWGKNEFGKEGLYQSILKRIDLPIVPRKECEKDLREAKLGSKFRLDESFICAGGEPKKDTCKGDGGSPLVCQVPGSDYFVQYGIVSWGLGCGTRVPAVYVNVPKFTPWIEEKLKSNGLDIKWFQP